MSQEMRETPQEHLRTILSRDDLTEVGLADFLRPYARSEKVTFEQARDWTMQSLDRQEMVLTDRFRLRLP